MTMRSLPRPHLALCAAAVCALCTTWAPAHATVYKWVDAQGQTHYGERPPEAAKQAKQVKVPPPGPAREPNGSSTDDLVSPRKFATPALPPAHTPSSPRPYAGEPKRSLSGGRDLGTPESRCNLARDVLSGAVRHRNGKPTDAYDREVARNDVKEACGGRSR